MQKKHDLQIPHSKGDRRINKKEWSKKQDYQKMNACVPEFYLKRKQKDDWQYERDWF